MMTSFWAFLWRSKRRFTTQEHLALDALFYVRSYLLKWNGIEGNAWFLAKKTDDINFGLNDRDTKR